METRILQAVNASSPSFTPTFSMYLDQVVGVGLWFRLVVVLGRGRGIQRCIRRLIDREREREREIEIERGKEMEKE